MLVAVYHQFIPVPSQSTSHLNIYLCICHIYNVVVTVYHLSIPVSSQSMSAAAVYGSYNGLSDHSCHSNKVQAYLFEWTWALHQFLCFLGVLLEWGMIECIWVINMLWYGSVTVYEYGWQGSLGRVIPWSRHTVEGEVVIKITLHESNNRHTEKVIVINIC